MPEPDGADSRRLSEAAAAETERLIAWLRVPAIALIAAGEALPHPNPRATGFTVAIVLFSAWSAGLLAWVSLRPVTERLAIVATAMDVGAITALAVLSGGAFSQARLAYFLVPVAVAFRFRPAATAAAAASTVVAYLAQAFAHPAASQPNAVRFALLHAAYLTWVGVACVLLSLVLQRRTRRVADLVTIGERLMADALTAEERERQALAEGLHDHAIQNLLSARHELEEAIESQALPSLERADRALVETVAGLRDTVFELHPQVLDQAGLEVALPAVAQRAARRGGFRVHWDLQARRRYPHERLLLGVARELLANVAQHAAASDVTVRLAEENGEVILIVADNGCGFDPVVVAGRLTEGHIGLASQRVRVESVGGRLEIDAAPGRGATVAARVPSR